MELFSSDQKISEAHGKMIIRDLPKNNTQNLPTGRQAFYTLYHPAAALYNGGMREVLLKDFKRIPKVLKKINGENKK